MRRFLRELHDPPHDGLELAGLAEWRASFSGILNCGAYCLWDSPELRVLDISVLGDSPDEVSTTISHLFPFELHTLSLQIAHRLLTQIPDALVALSSTTLSTLAFAVRAKAFLACAQTLRAFVPGLSQLL